MRACTLLLLALVASACLAFAVADDASPVIELTEDNIDEKLSEGTWLVSFTAPWCGHCRNLKPAWAEAAKQLKAADSSVKVANVNCDANQKVNGPWKIRGYPTIKMVHDGEFYDYPRGMDRSKESLIAFAEGGYRAQNSEKIPTVVQVIEKAKGLEGEDGEPVVIEEKEHAIGSFLSNHPFRFIGFLAAVVTVVPAVAYLVFRLLKASAGYKAD